MSSMQKERDARLSLCWGSMEGVAIEEFLTSAASVGFRYITLSPAQYVEATTAGYSDKDIALLLQDHGLTVSNVDPLFNWLPGSGTLEGSDPIAVCTQASMHEVFRIAHIVGTDLVNAPLGFAVVESEQEIVDSFGQLCEAAAREELRVCLEFMPFTQANDLATAARIVHKAACANGGIMFDCWHHHRSGGTASDVLTVPAEFYFAIQLDDALPQPMTDSIEETLNYRCLPGAGCIDLSRTLQNLVSIGVDAIYDVEVFDASLRALPALKRAQRMYESATSVVAGL